MISRIPEPLIFLLALFAAAGGLGACGGGIDEFASEEEAVAHYEKLSREYADYLIAGDLGEAWDMTSRELRQGMSFTDFKDKHRLAFRQWGEPTGVIRFHADTIDPAVLIEEIFRFPAKVSPEERRAVTVLRLRTEEDQMTLWLYFSGDPGREKVSAFEFGWT